MERSNRNRVIYQFKPPIRMPVDSATVIKTGDIVWKDTDDAKPANHTALWDTDEGTTCAKLKDNFLGIALESSESGDTREIAICPEGVAEMPCSSGTFELGDGVSGKKDGNNNYLYAQGVKSNSTVAQQIGRVWKRVPSADVKVQIHFVSSFLADHIS